MKYKIILVAIIHRGYKSLLLIKRAREPFIGKWSLTGGFGALEKGEDPNKAIVLEVYQDLGVKFNGKFYTFSFEREPEPTIKLFFQGNIGGEPFINSRETISEIKWFDIDETLDLELAFNDKEILKKFRKDFLSEIEKI